MRRTAARIIKLHRRAKTRADWEEIERKQRRRIQSRLVTAGFPTIRLQDVRATLGEPFHCARRGECIVTFEHQHAHYVGLTSLEHAVDKLTLSRKARTPQDAWNFVLAVAERWANERKPITHPTWGK